MSIIYDALKKAQKQMKSDQSAPVDNEQTLDNVELLSAAGVKVITKKNSKSMTLLFSIVSLAVILVGLSYLLTTKETHHALLQRFEAIKTAAMTDSKTPSTNVSTKINPAANPNSSWAGVADSAIVPSISPTTVTSSSTQTHSENTANNPAAQTASSQDLTLNGTAIMDGKRMAYINNKPVFVGDSINGKAIISIGAGQVELKENGQVTTLHSSS